MDANKDGFLEQSELQQACREVFKLYNQNGDAQLTLDEYAGRRGEASHTMGGFVRQHVDEIDANGDQCITMQVLFYEDAQAHLSYGLRHGAHSAKTPVQVFKAGQPRDFVDDTLDKNAR
ncbi:EF hand [Novipirellula aureliae]|uniref:EF hand n=1 Tax=Novipirellula aureliae TaxID=2527966 RepID=A0A5C6E9B7_9BACT|nr:EF-hand domain-containing protein [Novipirellula aureliae]TWU45105.1 EF hand [Novipirellula aureliae]